MDAPDRIESRISSIENFIILNKACGNPRRLVPLSSYEHGFVSLSELDLIRIFWADNDLQSRLQWYAKDDYPMLVAEGGMPSQPDVINWISGQAPGCLINMMLTDIGSNREGSRGKPKGFRATTSTMTLTGMRHHIRTIQEDSFDPKDYNERGYILRGSIRTDGFLLQLLAYKMNELNSVKYRRLPVDKLPSRITSTLGGTDYHLTEIRNVVRNKQDVADLWGDCQPCEIKVLGIDPGQACVIGASALLPSQGETKFYNLAVKQKATYQPTLKHRRWMQRKKTRTIFDSQNVGEIESALPPTRGDQSNFKSYVEQLKNVDEHLESFYNINSTIKKHRWNAKRARDEEYKRIGDSLLRMIGGSIGRKRKSEDKSVIALGLGKFSSKSRLSSLHESFQSYFVRTVSGWWCLKASVPVLDCTLITIHLPCSLQARSLGYIVVGVNEYYTSKKCPTCQNFVGQVEIRRLYCSNCKTYHHRDVMAGHNICNVVRGHLLNQERPLYLQPMDATGTFPWMRSRGVKREASAELEEVAGESSSRKRLHQ